MAYLVSNVTIFYPSRLSFVLCCACTNSPKMLSNLLYFIKYWVYCTLIMNTAFIKETKTKHHHLIHQRLFLFHLHILHCACIKLYSRCVIDNHWLRTSCIMMYTFFFVCAVSVCVDLCDLRHFGQTTALHFVCAT